MRPSTSTSSRRRQPRRAMYEVNPVQEPSSGQADPWAGEFEINDDPSAPGPSKSFPAPPPPLAHVTSRRTSTPSIRSLGPPMADRALSVSADPSMKVPSTDNLAWNDQINVEEDLGWDDPSNDIVISPVVESRIDASDPEADQLWMNSHQPKDHVVDSQFAPFDTDHSSQHHQNTEFDHEIGQDQEHAHGDYLQHNDQPSMGDSRESESQNAYKQIGQDDYDDRGATTEAQFPEFEYQNEFDQNQQQYANHNEHGESFEFDKSEYADQNDIGQKPESHHPEFADEHEHGRESDFDQPEYHHQNEHEQHLEFDHSEFPNQDAHDQNAELDHAVSRDQYNYTGDRPDHKYSYDGHHDERGGLQDLGAEDNFENENDFDWMHQESSAGYPETHDQLHQGTDDAQYQGQNYHHLAKSWEYDPDEVAQPELREEYGDHALGFETQEGIADTRDHEQAFNQNVDLGEVYADNVQAARESVTETQEASSTSHHEDNSFWDKVEDPEEDYAHDHENSTDHAPPEIAGCLKEAPEEASHVESAGIEQQESENAADQSSPTLHETHHPVDDFFSELGASPDYTARRSFGGSDAITETHAENDYPNDPNFDHMRFEQSLMDRDHGQATSFEQQFPATELDQALTRLPMRHRLSGLDDKFKSLDLDDDLMMDDDDFLDEMPLPVQQIEQAPEPERVPIAEAAARNKYQPSQGAPHHNIYASSEQAAPAISLPAEPAANIYDFPASFVPQQVKPAKRTQSTKYAAPQALQAPPSLAPGLSVRRDSINSAASSQPGQSTRVAPATKPFYEELPMPLPIPTQKARRVASVVPPQPVVTPALSQPPLVTSAPRAPPANPYTPAAAPPQMPQTPIGLVPPPQLSQAQQGLMPQPLPSVSQQAPSANARSSVSNSKYAPPRGPDPPSAPPAQNPYAPSFPSLPNPQVGRMVPQSPRQILPPIGNQNSFAQMGQPPMGQPPMGQPPMGQPPMGQQYGQSPLAQPAVLTMAQPPMGQQYGQLSMNQQLAVPSPSQLAPRQTLGSLLPQPSGMSGRKSMSNPRTSAGSQTSPYVPNTGPYAPINHHKHSRASSLVGAKGKEVNPYAPLLPTVNSTESLGSGPGSASLAVGPGPLLTSHRARGLSTTKSVSLHKTQSAPRISNPEALSQRQFPIFNWNASSKVVSLIPKMSSFPLAASQVSIRPSSSIISHAGKLMSFPGPLSKSKTRKKDVEKWLEESVGGRLASGQGDPDDILLDQVLQCLVKHDADVASPQYAKDICAVLNPSVNYTTDILPEASTSLNIAAKAFKLDTSGINSAFGLVLTGQTERALDFAIARSDWAFALVIANFSGPAIFARVVADYARINFPFQKSGNKVHHFMPLLLKLMSNNIDSVMEDLNTVLSEGDYAALHWRELAALVIISASPNVGEFLTRFAQFLAARGNLDAAHICLMLTATPLSPIKSATMSEPFASLGLALQTEVYEYALALAPNSTMLAHGLPHLLLVKLRHACLLADCGLFQNAQRYGDFVNACIKSAGSRSPFVSPQLLVEFQRLAIRVSEGGNTELSWLGSKMSKVNLNSVWFQLDKFIGGDEPNANAADTSLFSKFSPSLLRNASVLDFGASHHKGTPQMQRHFETQDARMISPGQMSSNTTTPRPKPKLNRMLSTASVSSGRYLPTGQGMPAKPTQPPIAVSRSTGSVNVHAEPVSYDKDSTRPERAAMPKPGPKILAPESAMPPLAAAQSIGHAPPIIPSAISSRTVASSVNSETARLPVSDAAQYTESAPEKEELAPSPMLSHEHQETDAFRYDQHSPMHSESDVGEYPQHFKPHVPEVMESEKDDALKIPPPPAFVDESLSTHAPEPSMPPGAVQQDVDNNESNAAEKGGPKPHTEQLEPKYAHDNESFAKAAPRKPLAGRSRVSPGANPYAPSSKADGSGAAPGRFEPGGRLSASKYAIPEGAKPAAGSNSPVRPVKKSSKYDGFNAPEMAVSREKLDSDQPLVKENPREHVQRAQSRSASPTKGVFREAPKMPIPVRGSRAMPNSRERVRASNIDDSFNDDDNVGADESMMSRNEPLVLNRGVPKNPPFPYSGDQTMRNELDHGFREFPIPGSPELTTRANSVMGRPSGLYSSRLSQCQQSEMYQNYEVQDDTVDDYVPIEEDEDEDEDAHLPPVPKREVSPVALAQEIPKEEKSLLVPTKSADKNEGSEKGSQKGWFSWRGKDDGKPKPTRAHLGNESPFYYDEKHKRWLDKNKPVEEQLVSAAPPPPPSMKKNIGPSSSGPGANGQAPLPSAPSTSGLPTPTSNQAGANMGAPPSAGGAVPPTKPSLDLSTTKPSLANAGIDDLLSLTGSNVNVARKPGNAKRSARRGYINVMEQ